MDVWAVGILAYELVTGKFPYDAGPDGPTIADLANITFESGFSPEWADFVAKVMSHCTPLQASKTMVSEVYSLLE